MRHYRRSSLQAFWSGFACLLALSVFSTPAASDQGKAPRFEKSECWFTVPKEKAATCGHLIVLEDRTKPDGRRVSLPIVVIKASGANRLPDPVVFLSGGPGQGIGLDKEGMKTWWSLGKYWGWMKNRDLILFEQRGTGLSEPSLNCPEVDERGVELMQVMQDADHVRAIYTEALDKCRTRLTGDGIDLARYGTRDTASDIAELRQVLGLKQYNLAGVSYGTRLALTTMHDHPEGIRSVILDSVYPPEVRAYESRQAGIEAAFQKLFDACRVTDYCRINYPELEISLFKTIAWLDTRPLPVTVPDPRDGKPIKVQVTGQTLVELTRYSLAFDNARYTLPAFLNAVSLVDPSVLEPVMSSLIQSSLGLGLGEFSEGKYYAIECNEEIPFNDPARVREDAAKHRRFAGFAYQLDDLPNCDSWRTGTLDQSLKAPIASDIPTLVLSGELDPITPTEFAETAVSRLKNGQLVKVTGSGHSLLTTSPCAIDIAAAFLKKPMGELKSECSD
jgi:pimeloyl-ACP methyl ester carboxylesterase